MALTDAPTLPEQAEIENLRNVLRGELLLPVDEDYEAARRVWNGNIDRHPALIVRPAGVPDVQQAVLYAQRNGLRLAVRGGGHSAPGHGTNDDGLVIDLSSMKSIRVDPDALTVRAEGGVLWAELDHDTQAFGLATPGGTVSNTGIAGLTLGGGLGWLMGKHGLTIDNLLSADVVTADGRYRKASPTENTDLFWALRGGGGNFGVVTSFEYRLHPVGEVMGGMLLYPIDQAREVLRFYRDLCPTLPDEAEAACALLTSPDGMPVAALLLCYNGPLADGERVFAAARSFGPPMADLLGPMPYGIRQTLIDQPNAINGLHRYWRSAYTEQISDDLIEVLAAAATAFSSPLSALLFFYLHGAATRVSPTATAFAARKPQFDFDAIGQWADPTESSIHIPWLKNLWGRLDPHLTGTAYINHLADDDRPEKIRESFGENYSRLRQIKAKYDPDNLFRANANIPPGSTLTADDAPLPAP